MKSNEQAPCAEGVMSTTERADLHRLLDTVLDAPNSQGVVMLAASIREGSAMVGCLVRGLVSPQDVVMICSSGGSQLLKQMEADERDFLSEVRQ